MYNQSNQSYYKKVLTPFVEDLVREYHYADLDGYYIDIDDIDQSDLNEFAGHLLACGNDGMSFIAESGKDGDILSSLLTVMQKPDIDNKLIFSDEVMKCAADYYREPMVSMLEEFCNEMYMGDRCDADLRPFANRDNGEIAWVKR